MSIGLSHPVKSKVRDEVEISFRFRPNGSGVINNALNKGAANAYVTAHRISTGLYELRVYGKYGEFILAHPTFVTDTINNGHSLTVAGEPIDNTTYLSVYVGYFQNSAGTFAAADIASDANNWIAVTLKFRDTSGTR